MEAVSMVTKRGPNKKLVPVVRIAVTTGSWRPNGDKKGTCAANGRRHVVPSFVSLPLLIFPPYYPNSCDRNCLDVRSLHVTMIPDGDKKGTITMLLKIGATVRSVTKTGLLAP